MPVRGVILIALFVASLPACFLRPFYGILLWTVVAFLNPQWYTWSAARSFPWAMAVAIPTLAGMPIFVRGWHRRLISRELVLLAVLWIWFSITSLISTRNPLFADHAEDVWLRWIFVSKVLLMTVVTIAIVESYAHLRALLMVIAACFGFFVIKALPFMIRTGAQYRVYGPEHSMIADNNDFGLALDMTLPLFFFLSQTEPRRWLKRLFGFMFVITIPAIFFTYSRGALIGLLTVSALMFLQIKRRLVLVPVIVLAILIAIQFAPGSWKNRMDLTSPIALDASARSRLNAWTFSWRLASDFPVAGGGFDTFTPGLFARYAPNPQDVHGPHSVYFGILAEHGFVGLGLYLTLIGSCFISLHRLIKRASRFSDSVTVSYANALRLGIVGFLATGTFLGRAYFDYFFTVLACLLVLKRLSVSRWTPLTGSVLEEVSDQHAEPLPV